MEQKKHSHADLEKLYSEADSVDQEVFAEMRSNLLLIAGEHYNRKAASYFRRLRDSKEITDQQKLRLTKNHIQKITKTYANNIISMAPNVGFSPKIESELACQKSAELHHAVWEDAWERYQLDEKRDDWCDDFIGVGEVHTLIFWDETGGSIKGYRQAMGEDEQLLFSESGDPLPDYDQPVHEGEFIFSEVYGFNVLRAPEAKSLKKSPYIIVREMTNKDELLAKFPDKKSIINESYDQTVVVFDPTRGGYRRATNEVMLKKYFFRPCAQYPNGYFYFATREGILIDGELPGGIWPLVSEAFDKVQTSPRGRSPVKTMRPYQAEINRSASKMAEHQITIGDDKLLIQNGTKISAGVALPGVRSINYTGQQPGILEGRNGAQYLDYMNSQITELYQVMNVQEDSEEQPAQLDPYTMLFRSAAQKKKFQRYVRRFERFLINVAKLYMRLSKIHMPDDSVIMAVGRAEQVNIQEFRQSDDLNYTIKVEPESDDIETKMGKQLFLNHIVQYAGTNLSQQDLGKLIRLSPYANLEEGFSDLTIDYDAATNMILALDRGEQPFISEFDDPKYMIRRLTGRMRQADFRFLPAQIQQAYKATEQQYSAIIAQQAAALQQAEAGFIPYGGYLVVCDFYVADPEDPNKTRRARLPYESIKWLIEKLESQGQSLQELENMNTGALNEVAQRFLQLRGQGSQPAPATSDSTMPPMGQP